VENSTIIEIILAIIGILISGSYPLFGMYLKAQGRKFDILFGKTDELEKILPKVQTDIKWLKDGLKELRDLQNKQGE
jgi:hypothetical protein